MTNPVNDYNSPFYNIEEKSQKKIMELFADGDLLTYSVNGDYFANKRNYALALNNKTIKSTISKYSLECDHELALFSNGKLLLLQINNKMSSMQKKFIERLEKDGFKIKDIEITDSIRLLFDINLYAQRIYSDKLVEVDIPDEKSFLADLFKDGNVCISATDNRIDDSERKFMALFSDGRFIVSNRYIRNKYNRDLSNKVEKVRKKLGYDYLIFDAEYVPDSYVKSIYNRVGKKIEEKKEEPQDHVMNEFIANLFANNAKCLTISDLDDVVTTERDVFALFDNDRYIVNEDEKHSASALEFAYNMMQKKGKFIVPEYVPAKYLPAIYKRALQTQKSSKDIFVEKLKKKAKKMGNEHDIPHHDALEKVAVETGFKNWKQVCDLDEDIARVKLGELQAQEATKKIFGLS